MREPTSSPEAKAFKQRHAGLPITLDLIDRRESLFLNVNNRFDAEIDPALQENNVATTSSHLVTRLSHAVMRTIVNSSELAIPQIVEEWGSSARLLPRTVVLTHAPMDVIEERILERQSAGMAGEALTGFNSLYFLAHYQDALREAHSLLPSDISVFSYDSTKVTASEAAARFMRTS